MEEIPTTINEIFMQAAGRYHSSRALCHKLRGRWVDVSHEEALRRARRITLGLYALGVRKSDPILLLAENSLEWILADLGALFCGAADVPLYHNSSPAQVEFIGRESKARLAFVSGAHQFEKLQAVRADLPDLERVIVFAGPQEPCGGGLTTLAELEALGEEVMGREPQLFDSLWRSATPADRATIIYTSGTTGTPKGVILTHGNIASNVIATHETLKIGKGTEIALSYLPFTHVFERNIVYGYFYSGTSICIAQSLDTVAADLGEVRPTIMTNVPRMFEKIYQNIVVTAAGGSRLRGALIHWCIETGLRYAELSHQGARLSLRLRARRWFADVILFRRLRQRMGGRMRYLVSGGAPLAPDLAYLFLAAGLPVLQGYGLTETSPVVSVNPSDANRIGTVGKPIPGVEVRIAPDGEILVRGPGITPGYFRREADTQAAFDNGWFKTGDLGRFDEKGYLVVTGRKKDLIKTSGGKYVAPLHVESLILASRFISQAVVIGNDRKFPSALIVPNAQMVRSYAALKGIPSPTYAELLRHPKILDLIERQVAKYTAELPHYEKIKRFVLLEHEFSTEGGELTLTQKLRRQAVESKYRPLIDSMYQEEGSPFLGSGGRGKEKPTAALPEVGGTRDTR